MKTGVPVSPSVCKFTKDVGRSGREENPGNNLQTISYIFRKLNPGAPWRLCVAMMHFLCDRRQCVADTIPREENLAGPVIPRMAAADAKGGR